MTPKEHPPVRGKTLIFLHIPKAAGSTLHSIIERNYPKESIYTIDGSRVLESIKEFKTLPESKRAEIRCVKGHMPFGLHMSLPQPTTYVTVLRDPIDRVISHYYFVLRTPSHYLHDMVVTNRMSLEEYVSSRISPELVNGQTRDISGIGCFEMVDLSDDVLEIAKRNLKEYFAFVGLGEKFDESLLLMRRTFSWRNIFYVKQNVSRNRPLKSEIPIKTLKAIEEHNKLDMELCEFAKQILEEQIREQGPSFKYELRTFRLLNKVYGTTWKSYKLPRSGINKLKAVVKSLLTMQR